jgi:hypothetical protein
VVFVLFVFFVPFEPFTSLVRKVRAVPLVVLGMTVVVVTRVRGIVVVVSVVVSNGIRAMHPCDTAGAEARGNEYDPDTRNPARHTILPRAVASVWEGCICQRFEQACGDGIVPSAASSVTLRLRVCPIVHRS